jgi:hypothetical protein
MGIVDDRDASKPDRIVIERLIPKNKFAEVNVTHTLSRLRSVMFIRE